MKKIISLSVLLVSLTSFSQLTLSDSLIAYFPFNGNSLDESGNGYDATNYGATLTQDRFGNINSAYEFDGLSNYMNTFSTFDFEFRTMSLWVRPFDISGNSFTEKHIAGQDANTLIYGQLKAKFSNDNLEVRAGGEVNNFVQPVINNTWYHIVLVRDGNQSRYYLNNILIGNETSGSVGSSGTPNESFVIGTGRELTNQFFEGVIDEIRIYNRALAHTEIDSLYSEENPSLGVSNPQENGSEMFVYPNPTNGTINLKSESEIESVLIYNSIGELVGKFNNKNSFSVAHLANGQYFLSINQLNQEVVRKVIIIEK